MAWTEDVAKKLADRVLSYSKAPECEVWLEATQSGHTRFAASDVTTSGSARDLTIAIVSRGNGRTGTVRVNDTDPAGLKNAVARSEEVMAAANVDPEWVDGLPPQKYPEVRAFHERTMSAGAPERKDGVKVALELARGKKLAASGYSETTSRWSAVASRKGNFGFFASTSAEFSTTMRTDDGTGSGWAGLEAPDFSSIPAAELAGRAARKAVESARPRDLEPGRYTVVFEPRAVADLLGSLNAAMSRRAADEGRSFFSKPGGGTRVGEKIFADNVTIRSDPFDARLSGRPWIGGAGGGFLGFGGFAAGNFAGLPARRTTWIEKGVLRTLPIDRYWAKKTGEEPLPFSGGLVMEGGSGAVEDLIAGTDRGLLLTRFWYIRTVNPQTVQLTGLTRDGVWLIEKGKVAGAVNNFRFNDSPVNLLKNVEAMSAAVSTGDMVVPAIRSRDFNFTSKSDAV
ncbi:MAG TPA: metallopeptidase TldD-related protein [Thermoanaerobaculia bacterium]|jgi:predicted Zn-dependent protease|nr:metallopeptidase TldD-related protein [Thermoanaerobaculia bacterium]HEV8610249.1 metallopeptidase TldD-related protein [Thermoanaerobaculia bacterium]